MSSQYEIEGRRLRLELRSVDSGSVVTVADDTANERSDKPSDESLTAETVSYTHLRAHET